MADVSRARRKIASGIAVLALIDLGAIIYLALPLRAGAARPTQVQQQADREYQQLSRKTVPLRGIDQKLSEAQKQDAAFMQNRLPSRYSDVLEELGKLANANHINITAVAYKDDPAKLSGIDTLEMHAGLAGSYVDLVRFINAIERDKMFFIIDSIGFTGENQGGEVRLDLKLETYLRNQSTS